MTLFAVVVNFVAEMTVVNPRQQVHYEKGDEQEDYENRIVRRTEEYVHRITSFTSQ